VTDRCEDEIPLKRTARQAVGRPKKTAAPAPPRIPRITRLMALAIRFQEMIDRGEVKDYADLARLGFVTRARLTQIMNLTLLAPDIQEKILFCSNPPRSSQSAEHSFRALSLQPHWQDQWIAYTIFESTQSDAPESPGRHPRTGRRHLKTWHT
jgi:hypothetical protein